MSDQRGARWLDGAAPWNATYATKDDGYMVVAAIEAKFYRSFISGLGLASDPLFADFQQWDQEKWPQQKAAVAKDLPQRAGRIGPRCSVIWMLASRRYSHIRRALIRPISQSGRPIDVSETKCSPLLLHASYKRQAVRRDLS